MDDLHDISLNGDPFLLVPGGYQRAAEDPQSAQPGRLTLKGFGAGLLVPYDDTPGTASNGGWTGSQVRSVLGGAGLEPWPLVVANADTLEATPTKTSRVAAVEASGNVYFAYAGRLFRTVALTEASWGNVTNVYTTGGGVVITDLAYYRDDVLMLFGAGFDINRWNTGSDAAGLWMAGERGTTGVGSQGALFRVRSSANLNDQLRITWNNNGGSAVADTRWLDAPIVRLALFNGQVAIATRRSLYLMGGQGGSSAWSGNPEPAASHGGVNTAAGDFVFLQSFLGKLYTWLAGSVVEFDSSTRGWRATGPQGSNCYGACVAAGYLVVALETANGRSQVWGFDGQGWWLIADALASTSTFIWPVALHGAGDYDLMWFTHNSAAGYTLARLSPRSSSVGSYPSGGSWTSSLLTADTPDTTKAWRQVTASFSAPAPTGNPGSSDSITVTLEYSINAGETWTQIDSTGTTPEQLVDLEHTFSATAPPVSRYLQLRVAWSGVLDWAPVLTNLVVDYTTLDTAPRRQRWDVDVFVPDQLAGSGRDTIEELWDAHELASEVAFRDIDYATNAVERNVRVLDIKEGAPEENQAGGWTGGVVSLTLSEV